MSYIGRGLDAISNVEKLDNITFDGSATYALTKSSAAFTPVGKNNILISIDGVIQQGNFSVSTTNIVFDWSPTSSNTCDWILHIGVGVLNVPADGSIVAAKMAANSVDSDSYVDGSIDAVHLSANSVDSDAYVDGSIDTAHIDALQVTGAKLNTDVISAQTELAVAPADADEFMVSDGGVLKRIDYSLIKGAATVATSAPGSPSQGDLWFDSTVGTTAMYVYNGTSWDLMSNKFVVTGGAETTVGSYTVHTFTSSGTLTVEGSGLVVDYLIVAGGGGGGGAGGANSGGGGGGAGGVLTNFGGTATSLVSGTYSIVVGNGGSGGTAENDVMTATPGSDTTFNSLTAIGGGAGANSNNDYDGADKSGGSGAGGTGNNSDATGPPGSGTSGQGNAGGNSVYSGPNWSAGGGGGKGSVGGTASTTVAGNGGAGYDASSYVGSSLGASGYFGGGGGGGIYNTTSYSTGGSGGGGAGGGNGAQAGTNGTANTGGGGGGTGGASGGTAQVGGNGGSGICIIRYET
jgi:hypothetical protein